MPAIPGVTNGGVILNGVSSLPDSLRMLTVDESGNIGYQAIPSAPALVWGNITGTLSNQADLQGALDGKAPFVHGHAIGDVVNLSTTLTAIDIALAALDANKANASSLASYLPLAGGTLTGLVNSNSTADLATSPRLFSFQHNGIERGYIRHILDVNTGLPVTELSVRRVLLNGNDGMYNPTGISGGGASRIYFRANGEELVFQGQSFNHWLFISGASGVVQFGAGIRFTPTGGASGTADLAIERDASDTIGFRRGLNAQAVRIYNAFTDFLNHDRAFARWNANVFEIGTERLGSYVTGRPLAFVVDGVERARITAAGNFGYNTTAPAGQFDVRFLRTGQVGPDVTAGQTITASSNYGGSNNSTYYGAINLIDDVLGAQDENGWSSAYTAITNQWVRLQFGTARVITRLTVINGAIAGSNAGARRCEFQGSNDGTTWTKLPAIIVSNGPTIINTDEFELAQNITNKQVIEFNNSTAYTFYRLFMYNNWGSVNYIGLREIEMMEPGLVSVADPRIFAGQNIGLGTTSPTAFVSIVPTALDAGSPVGFNFAGAAHTTLSASTEASDVVWNLARNVQFSAGALATQRAFRILAPTYSFWSASTITNASTLAISGAPIAGTNATITNSWALNVESGGSLFNGPIVGNSTIRGTEITSTIGNGIAFAISGGGRIAGVANGVSMALGHQNGYSLLVASDFGLYLSTGSEIRWGDTADPRSLTTTTLAIARDATDVLGIRRGANAQRVNLYGSYTDPGNYRRLYLSSTTLGAFTLGVEGLGSGVTGNTLTLLSNTVQIGGASNGLNVSSTGSTYVMWGGNINFTIGSGAGGKFLSLGGSLFGDPTNESCAIGWPNGHVAGGISVGFRYGGATQVNLQAAHAGAFQDLALRRVVFEGNTNSFPMIRRNGASINFRLADDSGDTSIIVANATLSNGVLRSTNGIELRYNDNIAPFCVDFRNRAIIGANHALAFTANIHANVDAPADFLIQRDGTRSIGMYSASIPGASSGAAILNLYNARNDSLNYDRGFIRWNSNVLEIGTERLGSYTTARALALIVDGTQRVRILSTGIALSGGTVSGSNSFMAASIHGEASGVRAVKFCADGGLSSGADSFSHGNIPGYGSGNNTGQNSVTFSGAWASDNTAFSQGYYARSDRFGMKSWANGNFSGSNFGEAQKAVFIARRRTTDATPTTLMLDGSSARLTINDGEILGFLVNIVGSKSDGTAVAQYIRRGVIKRVGATTVLVGSVQTIGTDIEDNAATDVSITADDTNEALQIAVTGIAGETWRWVATVEAVDLGFGT